MFEVVQIFARLLWVTRRVHTLLSTTLLEDGLVAVVRVLKMPQEIIFRRPQLTRGRIIAPRAPFEHAVCIW